MSSNWNQTLEQNAGLEVTSGSLAATAAAVRNAADLRLYLVAQNYEETLCFQQTYVGQHDTFAGLMSHHHSYAHRGELADQPYFSFFKYDAIDRFSQVKWMLDNAVFHEPQPYDYGVYRWYVCDRWRLVYEHDADGKAMRGDLDELKCCIRDGRSIKVGIKQLFGVQNDDSSGPEHISFLSIMQPLIQAGHAGANCDFALSCIPQWPFAFCDGLWIGMLWPSSSGELICHLVEPGQLPFRRSRVRRGMQWYVANAG
ncbi:MAG: hypothetical protein ABGZ17_01035 [Planctomycetaceae bacterium]